MAAISAQINGLVLQARDLSEKYATLDAQCTPLAADVATLASFITAAKAYVTACYTNIEKATVNGVIAFNKAVTVFPADTQRPVLSFHDRLTTPVYTTQRPVDIADAATANALEVSLNARLAFVRDAAYLMTYAAFIKAAEDIKRELQDSLARFGQGKDRLNSELVAVNGRIASLTTTMLTTTTNSLQQLGYAPEP
jgi:hypothetical protein